MTPLQFIEYPISHSLLGMAAFGFVACLAIGRILSNGIAQSRADNKRSEVELATEEGLMEVLPAIEKRTHYLATFSNMSVLLGLLGTVLGVIPEGLMARELGQR